MNERTGQLRWRFVLQWFVVVAVGMLVAGMLAIGSMWTVGEAVERLLGEVAGVVVSGGLFGAFMGLGTGLGPGLLLRRWGIDAGRWTMATVLAGAIGMAFAFFVILIVFDVDTPPDSMIGLVLGLSGGLPFAVAQARILRQHKLPAKSWGIVVVLATVIGMVAGLPLGGERREWLAVGTMGLLFAAVTGLGMAWLLRQETAVAPESLG